MCGICGWVDWDGGVAPKVVGAMSERLSHRGPDGHGLWHDRNGVAAFGHRRLSVLDRSGRAGQPMVGRNGLVLSYNGEVYNFRDLRSELEGVGPSISSSGDTEVVLAALAEWQVGALHRFIGMFAFSLWNPERKRLLLARDRMGVKPLYWARVGRGLAFASEMHGLLCHPEVAKDLEDGAVASWLQLGTSCGERTLVKGVRCLPPGHMLEADDRGVRVTRWYDVVERVAEPVPETTQGRVDELVELLGDAVRLRLVSDVPLGCFLSSGVDSTAVVAAAHRSGARPECLTVAFAGGEDESAHASRTAETFGLPYRRVSCTPDRMMESLGRWTDIASDPIADPSLAPTWVVSEAARERWTVALSGDGGDELFSGYPRLRFMPRLAGVPMAMRSLLRSAVAAAPARRWSGKLRAALAASSDWEAYQALQGVWPAADAARLVGASNVPLAWPAEMLARLQSEPAWRRYRLLDLLSFLPQRVLAKVDRASMNHSLEVRVPLLDHRIVERVLSLPAAATSNKGLLRQAATRMGAAPVPRRKKGFEVPLASWLRGPLREAVARDLFSTTSTELGIDHKILREHWDDHLCGRADVSERLLAVAVLVQWAKRYL